jgi:hypothetical protein
MKRRFQFINIIDSDDRPIWLTPLSGSAVRLCVEHSGLPFMVLMRNEHQKKDNQDYE